MNFLIFAANSINILPAKSTLDILERNEIECKNKEENNNLEEFVTQFESTERTYDDECEYGIFPFSEFQFENGSKDYYEKEDFVSKNKENNENRQNYEISKYGILPTTNENRHKFRCSEYPTENSQFLDLFEDLGSKNQRISSFGIFPEVIHNLKSNDGIMFFNFDNNDDDDNNNNSNNNKNNKNNDNDKKRNNNNNSENDEEVNSVMMKRWKARNVNINESKYERPERSEHGSTYNISDSYVCDGQYIHSDYSYGASNKKQRIRSQSRIAEEAEREVEREVESESRERRGRNIIGNRTCKRNDDKNGEKDVEEEGSEFLFSLRPSFSLTSDDHFSQEEKRGRERGRDSGDKEWERGKERGRDRSRRERNDNEFLMVMENEKPGLWGEEITMGTRRGIIKEERGLLKFN